MELHLIKEFLKSGELTKIKDALYYLFDNKTYDDEIVALVAQFLTSSDRGLQSLAIDCLGNIPDEFKNTASKHIVQLIPSDNIEYRNIASDLLSKYGDVCYDYLKPYLSHPIADVRQFALDIWGNIGSKKDWEVVHSLLNDENKNVVVSAIMALGNIKVSEAVDDLIGKYNEDDEYKPFVLNSLGKIGGEKAKEFILNIINSESDQLLQLAAIDAIAFFDGTEEFLDYLLSKLPTVPSQVQPYFLKSICKIGKPYCSVRSFPQELRNIAREALKQEDAEIRKAALTALGAKYDLLDTDYLIKEMLRFDFENIELILQNVIINSSQEVFADFLEKLAYQKDSGEIFSYMLEFIFREWEAIPESNKIVLIETLLSLSNELPENILSDFCDWFNYQDVEAFKRVFSKVYNSQMGKNNKILEEIGMRFDLI